ncbi:MAG: tRNA preQ1(34) S-adenosylmethionine ribosyltransferase-isomerase QueA, partial [Syntrophomonadaceae bacterium]
MAILKDFNMDIKLFDYDLPLELIAQYPLEERDHSRLLIVHRRSQTYADYHFFDLLKFLREGDVLVLNDTKVIPARLLGFKETTGAKFEALLLHPITDDTWECLCGNARVLKEGTEVVFGDGSLLKAKVVGIYPEGIRHLRFFYQGDFLAVLERVAKIPLPPYINDSADKYASYQTIYAKNPGSSAAPTAGFHFTDELFKEIKNLGVEITSITLNIGLGTFRPVKVKDTSEHKMHSEFYILSEAATGILNKAKNEGRRIIAVGTTVARTLETVFRKHQRFIA